MQRLQTENATLRVEGIPALRANLAYEQPRNFRLLAQLSQFTGRELDMGSNDELFWFWIRRDTQPSVYFARHAAFADSPARDLIPDRAESADRYAGAGLSRSGRPATAVRSSGTPNLLEITSRIPSPRGDLTRVLLVDAKYGWAAQQHWYDVERPAAVVGAGESAAVLPRRGGDDAASVEVALMPGQPSQIAFDLDVGSYAINRLAGDAAELWTMPQIEGYPSVDIADPQFRPPVAAIPPELPGSSSNPTWRPGRTRTGRMPTARTKLPRTAALPDYPRLRHVDAV